jgi:hypothetical protein
VIDNVDIFLIYYILHVSDKNVHLQKDFFHQEVRKLHYNITNIQLKLLYFTSSTNICIKSH